MLGWDIQDGAKVGLYLLVHETQFIAGLLFINYCIIFHMNNYKPTFPHPVLGVLGIQNKATSHF